MKKVIYFIVGIGLLIGYTISNIAEYIYNLGDEFFYWKRVEKRRKEREKAKA